MFTTGSKYFLGISFLAAVAVAISLLFVNPSALAVTALVGLACAAGLLAGVVLYVRDGEATGSQITAAEQPAPTTSMWPLLTALGATLVALGTVMAPVVFIFGVVVLLAALVEWTVLAWSEQASSDDAFNASVRKRLLNPIEFPVLAAVGLGVVIFSFSRVMLAVNKNLGVTLFVVIGALLMVGGALFALRATLKRNVVRAICVVAAVGLVAAGITAAGSGMRPELVVAKEEDHTVRECDAKPSDETSKKVSRTISAYSGVDATINFLNGKLTAHVQGIEGDQVSIMLPRSSLHNIIFRNFDTTDVRLVAHLGKKKITEGVSADVVVCTQMTRQGAEQLLTFSIPKPSAANGPYTLSLAGDDSQSIEVVVP